jgi:hypothetical protein
MCPIAGQTTGDLYGYNLASKNWTNLNSAIASTQPAVRSSHGFAAAGNRLYVHGGWKNGIAFSYRLILGQNLNLKR